MKYVEGVPEYKFHSADTEEEMPEPEDKNPGELDFDEFYEKYNRLALGLAYERLNDTHAVEDVVQEVFLRLNKELEEHSFLSEKHAKSWLLRTTSNMCTDVLRRRSVEQQHVQKIQKEDVCSSPEEIMTKRIEEMEALARIDTMFYKLKGKNQRWYQVSKEYYCNEKTRKQLAEEFDMTYANMVMLMKRIRKWMGHELLRQNPDMKRVYPKEYKEMEKENKAKKKAKKKKNP